MNYEYDENNQLVKAIDGLGGVWIWNYDANGNLVHHKSPSTEWIKEYDDNNRETMYVCGDKTVVTSYDSNGIANQIETHV